MEILESLKEIVESVDYDTAIYKMKDLADAYGVRTSIDDEIISIDQINGLVRECLDTDETYGWAHVQDLLSDVKHSDATWYKYDCGAIQTLEESDIDGYLSGLVKNLKDDLLEEVQGIFDDFYNVICDLVEYYNTQDHIDLSAALELLNDEISSVEWHEIYTCLNRVEQVFLEGLKQKVSTDLSSDLTVALETVAELKTYQDFLN